MVERKQIDLRAVKTRRAIRAAFEQMICEMSAGKITVKELAERACINRKTFYLHYPAIEALFDEVLVELMDTYFEQVETTPEGPRDIWGHAQRFFMFLADQPESTERLICQSSVYDFGRELYREQMTRYRAAGDLFGDLSDAKQKLVRHFIRATALDFYRQWVRGGKAVPPEEAAELLSELTCHGVSRLMH